MSFKTIAKGTGRAAWTVLSLPWRAVKMNLAYAKRAKQTHQDNIVLIRDLFRDAARKGKATAGDKTADGQSFEEVMGNRPPDAPSIAQLERRFLLQKRLALWTCCGFALLALFALAMGNLLGIATLMTSLPLFFLAALSAQLRLWQLRKRRLSREEKGGLKDFINEIDGWYWEVLDPEYGNKNEEPK